MTRIAEKDVLQALEAVEVGGKSIVGMDIIKGLHIDRARVRFALEVDPARGASLEPLRQRAEKAVSSLAGVDEVTAILTAENKATVAPQPMPQSTQKRTAPDPHGMNKNPPLVLPIKEIIAVASGKGGVGKSTVAFNLAMALAAQGKSVGLLDADIYGPSVPTLAGIQGQKPELGADKKIMPLEAHGLKIMSIGFMMEQDAPLIWRGPMVQSAIYQMLRDVAWGVKGEGVKDKNLDVLIVDLPPGTGDAQLTIAQKVPLTGAIIVSTPQDLALIDARRAIEMFRKVNVPVLGIIENMSTHICSSCGHEEHIFGHGGAEKEAEKQGVPFLGAIPLSMDIRKFADEGKAVLGLNKDASAVFENMANVLLKGE